MNLVSWLIFGAIAGTFANVIDPNPSRGGIFGSIMLGIVGALVGGLAANIILGVSITGFNLTSVLIALLGALLVLFLGRSFSKT